MDPSMRQRKLAQLKEHHVQSAANKGNKPEVRFFSSKIMWGIAASVVLAILAVSLFMYSVRSSSSLVDENRYQAVFLSNGQVYFGKLHDYGTRNPHMNEVYYFQATDETTKSDQAQTLVKLGDEVHKPQDTLILSKEAILFVENLSDDSTVAQAIQKNK